MFDQNQAFLHTYFSGLWEQLDAYNAPPLFATIERMPGKRAIPTLYITTEDERHAVHSQYNPIQEAERWANANPMPRQGIACIVGWGLGYPAIEWIKQHGAKADAVIIIEPEPRFLRESLAVTNLKPLMNTSRVDFILGYHPSKIQSVLMKYADLLLNRDVHLFLSPFAERYPNEVFQTLHREIKLFYETKKRMLNHIAEMGAICQNHIFQNLPHLIHRLTISEVKHAFSNEPAIIVGAAPSLDLNIDQLAAVQDRAWIIAVDTAARVLLRHGVQPHFIVTKDPSERNTSHFQQLTPPHETLLAFDPQVSPEITRSHAGKLLYIPNRNHLLHQHLPGFELKPDDLLPLSNNVAITAFHLAVELGCSPMVFVGLDFCFAQSRSHADGTALNSEVAWDNEQSSMTYSRGDAHETVAVQWIEGIDGKTYPTTPAFYEALHRLEQEIAQCGIPCIDASEGGAKIQGTEILPLRQAVSTYCTVPISPQKWFNLKPKAADPASLLTGINACINILSQCNNTAAQACTALQYNPFNPVYAKAQREAIEDRLFIYQILQSALERWIVEIHQPGYWDESLHSPETIEQRYQHYFAVIQKTTAHFIPILEEVRQSVSDEHPFSES